MIKNLPFRYAVETKEILKLVAEAHRHLGELKGVLNSVPNQSVLLHLLPLQEAIYSSQIENIVTTHDQVFRSKVDSHATGHTKEVRDYADALVMGFDFVTKKQMLNNKMICDMQAIIIGNNAGFRTQAGTKLKNNYGEVIYTPPQDSAIVKNLMGNLEQFINDSEQSDLDPLIKMAIIHHQFESIHPFYDGNGRIGRIINILYLCLQNLLDLPILYLSGYIIDNKDEYYRLLQTVRDKEQWQQWIKFILQGVALTSITTTELIKKIVALMATFKHSMKSNTPKMYSQDLINALFKYPYTKVKFIKQELNIHEHTARKYLKELTDQNLLSKFCVGNSNYYLNAKLVDLAVQHRKNQIKSM